MAAARLLAHSPNASMDDIARAAGISRATLFRRYPSRARLIADLSMQAVRAYVAATDAARPEDGPAAEALTRLVLALAPLAPTYGLLVLQPLADGVEAALLAQADSTDERVLLLVRRGQEEGSFSLDVSPRWALTTITWLIVGAADAVRCGLLAPAELERNLVMTVTKVLAR